MINGWERISSGVIRSEALVWSIISTKMTKNTQSYSTASSSSVGIETGGLSGKKQKQLSGTTELGSFTQMFYKKSHKPLGDCVVLCLFPWDILSDAFQDLFHLPTEERNDLVYS